MTRDLNRFIEKNGHLRPNILAPLLEAEVVTSGGTWITQHQAGGARPSHMFEIQVFGISGTGMTEEEAARNWHNAAREALADASDDEPLHETGAA